MADPFVAEIRIFPFNFAPKGWALANGQLLAINQNTALFSLLGTTFGGNGQTTFALPDCRGRLPMHVGTIAVLGQQGGVESASATSTTQVASAGAGLVSKVAFRPDAQGALPTLSPYAVLNFIIALQGIFPSRN